MKLRKIENTGSGKKTTSFSLAVPQHIGNLLPDGLEFSATLTEQGILFRPLIEAIPAGVATSSDDDADL